MATKEQSQPFKQEFGQALIAPFDQTFPFGKEEPLSHYIYEPMRETQSADMLIRLIDYAESIIETDDVNSEYNHLKILRLAALVADMPDSLPLEERTRAWRHLIGGDWVHMFGDMGELDRVIIDVADKDPELGDEIRKVQQSVFEEKSTTLEKVVGEDERVPRFTFEGFSLERAMEGYGTVQTHYPDVLPAYNTLVAISMSGHRMSVQ